MRNLEQLKRDCLGEIERAYGIVEGRYKTTIPRVPVVFSNKMTKTAGTVSFNEITMIPSKITLSLPLLKLNKETFVQQTPAHEAMHVAAINLFSYSGHGTEWKNLMRLVGRNESRRHQMTVVQTGVPAYCGCTNPLLITKHIANRVRKGHSYSCRDCKYTITLRKPPSVVKETVKEVPKPTIAKSDLVREAIAVVRANGITMQDLLDNSEAVRVIAKKAELTSALAKTYIKNNWKRV